MWVIKNGDYYGFSTVENHLDTTKFFATATRFKTRQEARQTIKLAKKNHCIVCSLWSYSNIIRINKNV